MNIAYGARYLRYLLDRHGTLDLALAAYNAGETNVGRWIDEAERPRRRPRRARGHPVPGDAQLRDAGEEAAPIYRRAYGDRLGPVTP